MTLHFDILQLETEGVRWVEAVPSMEDAQARVQELIACTKCDYIIFNQRTANRTVVRSADLGAESPL
jgi:hypothetical protein